MIDLKTIYTGVLVFLCVWVSFWTIYIYLFSLLGIATRSVEGIAQNEVGQRFVVLVAAHNAAEHIEGCIAAIKTSLFGHRFAKIIVIADHCTDNTKALATRFGAQVYERVGGLRGKSFSLKWFFEEIYPALRDDMPVVITDVTARVDGSSLGLLISPLYEGNHVSVGRAAVSQGVNNWLHAGTDLALRHRAIQNLCRRRLGLNPLIEGRIMAFSPTYLRHYGWKLAAPDCNFKNTVHPTEDWRHGLKIAQNHIKVVYVHNAVVWTPLRSSIGANTAQVLRWDQGRLTNARELGWKALAVALLQRNPVVIVAALDVIQPPQIHILICSLLLVVIGLIGSSVFSMTTGVGSILILIGYYNIILRSNIFDDRNHKTTDLVRWAAWRVATVLRRLLGTH